jgi:hypothetical protein
MEDNKNIQEVEYQIRKFERGIKVAYRCKLIFKETDTDYNMLIQQRVKIIKELRDKLEQLTEKKHFSAGSWKIIAKGRRRPNIPKWPVWSD